MERYQELFSKARENIQLADHMATMTYPLVKDPKLLIVSLENIFLGMTTAISAVLVFERSQKNIPPFLDTFEGRLNAFMDHCARKYEIAKERVLVLRDLKAIIAEHKESPMEFTKDGKFVICSPTYDMKVITYDTIKNIIAQGKRFLEQLTTKVEGYERIS